MVVLDLTSYKRGKASRYKGGGCRKKYAGKYLTKPPPQAVILIEKTRIAVKRSEAHIIAMFSLSTKSAGRIARFCCSISASFRFTCQNSYCVGQDGLLDGRFDRLASKPVRTHILASSTRLQFPKATFCRMDSPADVLF